MYVLGKVYEVSTLIIGKNGKAKMKKVKLFDLRDESGRNVETGIAKKERKFYKKYVRLVEKEGETL